MKKYLFMAGLVFIITFCLSYYLIINSSGQQMPLKANNHLTMDQMHFPENKYFESTITLNAVGDLLIHSSVYGDARTSNGYNFEPIFEVIKPYLINADITIANQETILGGTELGISSYPRFNSPQQLADTLKNVGVDLVSMANNHTLDKGEKAVLNATNYLNQIGIKYVGAYQSKQDQNQPRIINRKGIAVGFLAYTYGTNGIPVPKDKEYLVNLINEDQIINDIQNLKNKTDFIVVNMHFGHEYHQLPNDEQIHLAELLTNHGADVIIGHHPHVLQPVDWIATDQGDEKFVAYSLGNFLSGQIGTERLIGAITQIELTKRISKNHEYKYDVSNAKIMPTYTYYQNFKNFKIVPLKDASQYNLSNASQWFEDIKNLIQTFTTDIKVVPYLE